MANATDLRALGFIGDGASHTLSKVAPGRSLSDWQVIFPPNAATHSLGAVSLNDEVDGLAVQRAIDLQVPSGRVTVELPACDAMVSRAIRTNGPAIVSIEGRGGETSRLRFLDKAGNGFEHGVIAPGGPFYIRGVDLRGSSSGSAFEVVSGEANPSMLIIDCMIFGFSGHGLRGHNIRSSQFRGNIWSTLFGPTQRTHNCYELTHDRPSMQNLFKDKQILGYNIAYHWTISPTAEGIGYEGQYVEDVQINECETAFRVDSRVTLPNGQTYKPIDWKFRNLEIEVLGQIAYFENMRGIDYRDQYVITLGNTRVPIGWAFNGVECAHISGVRVQVFKSFSRLFSFNGTTDTRFRDNNINDQANKTDCQVFFEGKNIDFVESGSTMNTAAGLTFGGATRGLSIEYIAFTLGGTVDRQGRYSIAGRIVGHTDANGMFTIPMPHRPDGTPLFSEYPYVFLSAGDRNWGGTDTFGPVRPGNTTELQVIAFDPVTGSPRANVLREINYLLVGG